MECGFDVRKAEQVGRIRNDMSFKQLVLGWEAVVAGKPKEVLTLRIMGVMPQTSKGPKHEKDISKVPIDFFLFDNSIKINDIKYQH